MRAPRVWWFVAVMTTGAITLAACTGDAEGKSGAEPAATTVVLANSGNDLDLLPGVQFFVDHLRGLSKGRMTVRVASRWGAEEDEVDVLKGVAEGKADLGVSGTRALDQVGVRGLTPLNAPFLVDSYAAQNAVLADPAITQQLEGLRAAGLVGLALLADNLRMPVARAKPMVSVEDYSGAVIRVPKSDAQVNGLRALGARPATTSYNETMDGSEVSWDNYVGDTSGAHLARFVTVNTALWPRSLVIFANPEALEGLTDQERDWVEAAASDAARWSMDHSRDEETDQIAEACSKGVKVATADARQIASLNEAAQPFYQSLRDDPETATVMRVVERLTSELSPDNPPEIPAGCRFRPGDEALAAMPLEPLTAPGESGALPEGVYRYELTEADLSAAGLPENDVYENAGVFTWMIEGGRWSFLQLPANTDVPNTRCEGYYDVAGSRVAMSVSTVTKVGDCAPLLWTATWSSTSDSLVWSDVSVDDFARVWAAKPWQKIG